jgi:hypothetical protein
MDRVENSYQRSSIVACVSTAAGTCLSSRSPSAAVYSCLLKICCLAANVFSLCFEVATQQRIYTLHYLFKTLKNGTSTNLPDPKRPSRRQKPQAFHYTPGSGHVVTDLRLSRPRESAPLTHNVMFHKNEYLLQGSKMIRLNLYFCRCRYF